MRPKDLADRLPAILLAGWFIPGASHFLIGHRRRGIFLFVVLLSTFFAGFAMGGYRNVSLERQPISFAAQACMGSTCLGGWWYGQQQPTPAMPPRHMSLGTLYAAVAALLNLLCVFDAFERVVRLNLPVDKLDKEREKKQGPSAKKVQGKAG